MYDDEEKKQEYDEYNQGDDFNVEIEDGSDDEFERKK